jgi:hypothetical protein
MSLRHRIPKEVRVGRDYRLASLSHEDAKHYGTIVTVKDIQRPRGSPALAFVKTSTDTRTVALSDLRLKD